MGGIVFWWGISERFVGRESTTEDFVLRVGKKSFFVYACHMMMTEYCNAAASFAFKTNPVALTCYSFIIPFVVYACAYGLAVMMERKLPKAFSLLTGGRG